MLPGGSDGKESACSAGDPGLWPGLGTPPWRWKWQPTPVFLPGEFHGQRSLAGYSPWGCKDLDTTEWLTLNFHELKGACIFSDYSFVWVYAQNSDCWIIWQLLFLVFWGTSILFSIVAAPNLHTQPIKKQSLKLLKVTLNSLPICLIIF